MEAVIETFKPVKGYEGLYEVSDYGTVRSLYDGKVKYLKNVKQPNGYERICLYNNDKKYLMVHRLVYEAFNGQIPEGMQIDHVNGIKNDNRLVNLRCVTHKENMNNPITREIQLEAMRKLHSNSEWNNSIRKSCAKPVLQLNKQTDEIIRQWECLKDVERELGIYQTHISECCNGKRKSAGGFRWRFA